ncbi:hypothetical protein IV203_006902 [Nitzschia inconspicua]|uniref:Thioesterase domain-containing protein n=1 Tax=Nitzschia inconspicua TaxID=303405 RepID=A0A9K3KDU4_9STRA|nr:hypothetical protein IV203_006902 [Nitzschia inconspicua]
MHLTRRVLLASRGDKNTTKSIPTLLEFLSLQRRLEDLQSHQGFGDFLGLTVAPSENLGTSNSSSFNNVSKGDLRWEETTDVPPHHPALVYRYQLPKTLQYLQLDNDEIRNDDNPAIRLSTYMSILDEVSTWSMILNTFPHPRPGVSVTMSTEWGPAAYTKLMNSSIEAVDITTTVTKQGQTMGFLRSEVRDPVTSQVICHVQHTKFLDPGRWFRMLLTPQARWGLNILSSHVFPMLKKNEKVKDQEEDEIERAKRIMDSFTITGPSTATFQVRPQHTNGFGGLHGGVQAILMENLGHKVVKQQISNLTRLRCKRILASYQSSASKKVKLQAYVLQSQPTERTITLRVVVERDSSGPSVSVSEGILEFEYETR